MLTPLKDTVWPSPSDTALVTTSIELVILQTTQLSLRGVEGSAARETYRHWGRCEHELDRWASLYVGTYHPLSMSVSAEWASCENHCVSAAHSALAIIGKIPQRGMFITALSSGERTRTARMTGEANSDLCLRQTPSISLGLGERWTLLLGICEKWGSVEGKCNECHIHRCLLQGKRLFHILRENRIFPYDDSKYLISVLSSPLPHLSIFNIDSFHLHARINVNSSALTYCFSNLIIMGPKG